jgi:Smg protein
MASSHACLVGCFSEWAPPETGSSYIGAMFEVLAYVYENYWSGEYCPAWEHLERKLNTVGFEPDEIADALVWLSDLNVAATATQISIAAKNEPAIEPLPQAPSSMRVYAIAEQDHLGGECLGFVSFLEASQVLPASLREIVIERAMAAPGGPLALDDLKIIVLMVYWSFGKEMDALVLDELCDDASDRIAH